MKIIDFVSLIITIVFLAIHLFLSFTYCKDALLIFQQNHYELKRYSKYLFNKNNIKFSISLVYLILLFVFKFIFGKFYAINSLLFTLVFAFYLFKKELKKKYIKPLAITSRVKRQIVVYALVMVFFTFNSMLVYSPLMLGIHSIVFPYLAIYIVAIITWPIEYLIKKHYENDAKKILYKNDNLIKVGVTGSYGKTSTKNIINDILSNNYYTLITPSSYNTPMGITRTIRELLKPIHEVFICEMGADKVNDISYLMDFVKPKYGVVTAIGPQHLNTFNSIENIINEKMQEIEMLPSDGVGFINIDNEYIKNYKIKNSCKIVTVGINNKKADYVASDIKYSSEGMKFTAKINKHNYKFETSLLGEHNITNILLGIAIALELNIKVKDIIKNVKTIRQIEHRLELKKINGFTFIDDAFNANPVGSKMSLDVLKLMKGRRVIVTPGMIDLGKIQEDENYKFGQYMKNRADFVVLVGEKQTVPIYKGLIASKFKKDNIVTVNNINEAFIYVYKHFSSSDTILLENDLPDVFNN